MVKKPLHPSVQQFKEFVRSHPELIKSVRSGKNTWQELFEEWYLLGEENQKWDQLETDKQTVAKPETKKVESENKDWMSNVIGIMKNMDPNQLQTYAASLSSALGAIQGVIASLQGGSNSQPKETSKPPVSPPTHPFQFRQD